MFANEACLPDNQRSNSSVTIPKGVTSLDTSASSRLVRSELVLAAEAAPDSYASHCRPADNPCLGFTPRKRTAHWSLHPSATHPTADHRCRHLPGPSAQTYCALTLGPSSGTEHTERDRAYVLYSDN